MPKALALSLVEMHVEMHDHQKRSRKIAVSGRSLTSSHFTALKKGHLVATCTLHTGNLTHRCGEVQSFKPDEAIGPGGLTHCERESTIRR
jgi:hypothetical protein